MGSVAQTSQTYDEVYETGGHEAIYDLPYWRSQYYPLYKRVFTEIKRECAASVLEVGCGNGAFAHMYLSKYTLPYRGFDFSPIAVEQAAARCGRDDLFYVGDATSADSYVGHYDTIVCTEVLEHLPDDFKAIEHWPTGTTCICSVPNFNSRYHERFFRHPTEVYERYSSLLNINRIFEVFVPPKSDLGRRRVLAAVMSNVWRSRRMLGILGLPQIASSRRWFVFVATKI